MPGNKAIVLTSKSDPVSWTLEDRIFPKPSLVQSSYKFSTQYSFNTLKNTLLENPTSTGQLPQYLEVMVLAGFILLALTLRYSGLETGSVENCLLLPEM